MTSSWRNRLLALIIIVAASILFERQVSARGWNHGLASSVWITLIVGFSIAYRKLAGKPIIPRMPPDPIYGEGRASSGLASRCLIVAVTDDALVVGPRFPFNLMFLPEVWGIEYHIPIASIDEVRTNKSWLGANVRVLHGKGRDEFGLKVLDPDAFATAVWRAQSRAAR